MKTKEIDLQPLFVMNPYYFVKKMKEECFDILNAFLKHKSGVSHDPLFVQEEHGQVRIGYTPKVKSKDKAFFSNELLDFSWGMATTTSVVGFVIFEACKAYGCYEDVPMYGAPERGDNHYFTFTHEGTEYTFKLWTKR